MAIGRAGDNYFGLGAELPPECCACSRAFDHQIKEAFIYWQGSASLVIAFCPTCATKIGRNLIYDTGRLAGENVSNHGDFIE